MFRKIFFFLSFILFGINICSEEIRGIWVVRWDVDKPMKVFTLMDDIENYDINTIFVQVYARCEAMYKSEIAPRSTELLNAPFTYDPLELIIKLAHKRGVKVHAWLNLYYAWSHAPFPVTESHVSNKHPEWFIGDNKGINVKDFSVEEIKVKGLEGYFLEPGNREVREYLKKIVQEIVKNYDVDGLHMDYCRYPGGNYGYDIPARVAFMRTQYVDPLKFQDRTRLREEFGSDAFFDLQKIWNDWRREQITLTIKEIYGTVKGIKPNALVSVAVIGDNNHARNDLFQDWVLWAREGCVDFVVPMLYSSSTNWIDKKTRSISALIGRDKLAVGLGAYLQDYNNLLQEIIKVEGAGTRGYLLFSYGGMEEKGYFK